MKTETNDVIAILIRRVGLLAPIGLLVGATSLSPVGAAEQTDFYNGVRALGMGGAQVAVVNDETALLANPAGLGRLRDHFLTVIDPEIEVGSGYDQVAGFSVTSFLSPQATLALLKPRPGQRLHQSLQLFPSAVFPNFGIGLFGHYSTDAQVLADASAYQYRYRNDLAFVAGMNFRLFDGRVKLGANARLVHRVEVDRDDLDPNATNLSLSSLAREGMGVATDLGLILTAPWQLLPTLGVVYRDFGNTDYSFSSGFIVGATERPAATPARLDASLAIFPIVDKRTRSSFAIEGRDVLRFNQAARAMDLIHIGYELNFADSLFLRAGWHQNDWTAGLEFAVGNYQLQFATYAEQIGTTAESIMERRYVGKLAFRF